MIIPTLSGQREIDAVTPWRNITQLTNGDILHAIITAPTIQDASGGTLPYATATITQRSPAARAQPTPSAQQLHEPRHADRGTARTETPATSASASRTGGDRWPDSRSRLRTSRAAAATKAVKPPGVTDASKPRMLAARLPNRQAVATAGLALTVIGAVGGAVAGGEVAVVTTVVDASISSAVAFVDLTERKRTNRETTAAIASLTAQVRQVAQSQSKIATQLRQMARLQSSYLEATGQAGVTAPNMLMLLALLPYLSSSRQHRR